MDEISIRTLTRKYFSKYISAASCSPHNYYYRNYPPPPISIYYDPQCLIPTQNADPFAQ